MTKAHKFMIAFGFALVVAATLPLTGCSDPQLPVSVNDVGKNVDQGIQGAQDGIKAAQDLTQQAQAAAEKANQVIDLAKQIEGVVTK